MAAVSKIIIRHQIDMQANGDWKWIYYITRYYTDGTKQDEINTDGPCSNNIWHDTILDPIKEHDRLKELAENPSIALLHIKHGDKEIYKEGFGGSNGNNILIKVCPLIVRGKMKLKVSSNKVIYY